MTELLLERLFRVAHRRRAAVLAGGAALVIASLVLVSRVSFDSNILNLLPRRDDRLQYFEAYLREFGSLDHLYVLFEAPPDGSIEDYTDLIDAYVTAFRKTPGIERVDAGVIEQGKDWGYLLDRELLVLAPKGLSDALDRLKPGAVEQALAHARDRLTLPSAAVKTLVQQDPLGLIGLMRDRLAGSGALLAINQTGQGYVTRDGRSRLVIAKPSHPPYDTAFCKQLFARLADVEATARQTARTDTGGETAALPPLRIELAGAYRVSLEAEHLIRREAMTSSAGSLAGILLLVLIVFRGWRILVSGTLPIVIAALLALGLVGLTHRLSTAASGSSAMLFGLGIDGVILLYVRYLEERRRGLGAEDAAGRMAGTGVSMMMGIVTTAATFFGLVWIDFPTLQELGRLVGLGILICGMLALVLTPALLPVQLTAGERRPLRTEWLARVVDSHSRAILVAAILVTIALAPFSTRLRVVPTLARLEAHTRGSVIEREVVARFSLPNDVYLAVGRASELQPLLEANRKLLGILEERAPSVAVSSPIALLPTMADQSAAAARIRGANLSLQDMTRALDVAGGRAGFRPGTFTPFMERLPRLLDADQRLTYEGFRQHGLADVIGRYIARTPDGFLTATYLYPRSAEDVRRVEAAVTAAGSRLQLTGLTIVNKALADHFLPQFQRGIGIGTVAVAALIYLGFRSLRLTLLALAPTALGLLWSTGLLALFGVELDLFSAFAVLMCIGIGVDYGIHVLHRYSGQDDRSIGEVLSATGPAILLAGGTTLIGFGTLVSSAYGPLRSLGLVSAVTVLMCMAAAILVLPAVLVERDRP